MSVTKYMTAAASIVLINGVWTTAFSWEPWIERYREQGCRVVANGRPNREGPIEHRRRAPSSVAKLRLAEVADHYEKIICELDQPPIIIGHGVGGLVTQILLDRGWGAAGVGIATVPAHGILRLPFSTLKVLLPALGSSFRFFQTAIAKLSSNAASAVNFANNTRAPLLLVAAGQDTVVPSSLVRDNFELYRNSRAETEYKKFTEHTHEIVSEKGWQEVADYVLRWALSRTSTAATATTTKKASWSVQL